MERIAWVTPDYFLDTDVYIIEQMCILYHIDWYIITVKDDIKDYRDKIESIKSKGTNITLFRIHQKGMHPGNVLRFNQLLSRIKRNNAKLLYTSLSYPAYYLPLVKMRMGKNNVILAIHNVHVPKGGSHYLRNKYYNRFAIHAFQNYQTFSRSQYNVLREEAVNKNILYAPFILKDFGISNKTKSDDKVVFMSFGNIRDYKRIDVLIKAAQEAYEKTNIDFKVIIAGACDDWNRYEKLIRIPKLFDLRIRRIENSEIPDIFAECDYFVTPYQDIAQSGSAIIAINYGKPIIASRLPAFEEYIEDGKTGYFINPANKDDLREVIEHILHNYVNEYQNMAKRIENYRDSEFSTMIITQKYKDFIDEIIR